MQEKLTLFQEAFHANHFHRQENNKAQKESIKAYGNAICVPVAVRIFDTINKYENICS
jgi:hypothetical protein